MIYLFIWLNLYYLVGHIMYFYSDLVRVGRVVQRVKAQTGESSLAGSNPGLHCNNVCIWIISLPVSDIQFSVPFLIRLCLYRGAGTLLTILSTDPWVSWGEGGYLF